MHMGSSEGLTRGTEKTDMLLHSCTRQMKATACMPQVPTACSAPSMDPLARSLSFSFARRLFSSLNLASRACERKAGGQACLLLCHTLSHVCVRLCHGPVPLAPAAPAPGLEASTA